MKEDRGVEKILRALRAEAGHEWTGTRPDVGSEGEERRSLWSWGRSVSRPVGLGGGVTPLRLNQQRHQWISAPQIDPPVKARYLTFHSRFSPPSTFPSNTSSLDPNSFRWAMGPASS